jgi:hypothetical protein
MQAAAAQVNARIDPQLKSSGDAALASAGLTPTQAVRSLWEFASLHASSPEDIVSFLRPGQKEPAVKNPAAEKEELVQMAEETAGLFERRLQGAGVDPALFSSLDALFEDLKDRAWDEAEREGSPT